MATLPYVTAPGNIERALVSIMSAQTPERVTQDFVKTILKIPGGSGNQVTSFLKKIGFVKSDGTPSDVYKKFRNSATTGAAALEAMKIGYGPLFKRNEFMHKLSDTELRGLVIEETGQSGDSSVPGLVVAAIAALKKFASDAKAPADEAAQRDQTKAIVPTDHQTPPTTKRLGMNLSYTINLNLPATTDIAVFNAIFKSLKENLLKDIDER